MASVLDDHLLLDLLTGSAVGWLAAQASSSAIYTTSTWYYRVASAADHGSGSGALSGRIASLADAEQRHVRAHLGSLPDRYGLIGPRTLVPMMASLRTPRNLNFLSAEALALAVLTESTIAVRTDSPPLREACEAFESMRCFIEQYNEREPAERKESIAMLHAWTQIEADGITSDPAQWSDWEASVARALADGQSDDAP